MKDSLSTEMLRDRIRVKIKKLAEIEIFISGSFIRSKRKCGNPNCHCASGGEKHPCCLLTSKVKGKTKAIYVPMDMENEVAKWAEEYRKIRKLLKEVDKMSEQIIKTHVSARRAVSKNLKRLNL